MTKIGKNYDILIRQIVTEKTTKSNKYFFEVADYANKVDVKNAIEDVFKVSVLDVNIINTHAKLKRFRGIKGMKSSFKKAIITLAKGQNINFSKLE